MPQDEVVSLTNKVNAMTLSINDLENQVENLANTVSALTEQMRLKAVADTEAARVKAAQDLVDNAARMRRAQDWAVMQAEHNSCKERRQKEAAWLSGRFGAIVDKVLPVIIGAAFMYLYAKGVK